MIAQERFPERVLILHRVSKDLHQRWNTESSESINNQLVTPPIQSLPRARVVKYRHVTTK